LYVILKSTILITVWAGGAAAKPKTLTKEWAAAEAAKRKSENEGAITAHTVGKPARHNEIEP
jgi:hypothetical protein